MRKIFIEIDENEYRLIKDNERVQWLFLYINISSSN